MSRQVFRWAVGVDDRIWTIGGGRVVHVSQKPDDPADVVHVWTEEDPAAVSIRAVTVIGTGHPVPDGWTHVGSAVTWSGLVWHVYEEVRD